MEFDKRKTIKSSEIGQHEYCAVAWYLQRCGYKPDSEAVDSGLKAHVDLGGKINSAVGHERTSRKTMYVGLGLLGIVIVLVAWFVL